MGGEEGEVRGNEGKNDGSEGVRSKQEVRKVRGNMGKGN